MSSFEVTVLSASNLPNVETFGKSDPFVVVEFTSLKRQTKVIDDELNPAWDEKLEPFDLLGKPLSVNDKISVYVKDHEKIGPDRLLGQADCPLKDLLKGKNEMEINLNLLDSNKRPTGGTVNLKIKYNPPKSGATANTGGGSAAQNTDKGAANNDDQDNDPEDDGEDEVDEVDAAVDDPSQGGKPSKKQSRRRKIRGKRKVRAKLPNKPQDFQIRVKVIEARQLQGANISPVVRVTCWNQTKQTRVQNSTNSPFWGDVFFFNFNAIPDELLDNQINFGVYNSRRLRSDALIGSFKFDIGIIYDEPGHFFSNRWLLLSDPDDPMGGAKGYLKISAVVLGPGDEAPSFKNQEDEEEDIEANLLRPAGVQLRPATFLLRVYKGEDLPKMDTEMFAGVKKIFGADEPKELCDPYVVFSFAGKSVQSSIKYAQESPDFNEELKIGLQFPSMCEKLKIQCWDWDRLTEDDAIGTHIIDISQIAAHGDSGDCGAGFLPTFGPCFVNMYGSPREFCETGDSFEYLNFGRGEGVAYRGRLLVELVTQLDETPIESKCDMVPDTIQRVQKFLRRRKYRLHAVFLSANMVNAKDDPVVFEVSIGNYGNTLDVNVPPCSSTTQPTNPVFDGVYYYFLPWGNHKPCTVVESQWEDISFRLYTMNFLLRIADRLEMMLNKARIALQANLPENDQAEFVIAALDDLILECNKPMPQWEPGQSPLNDLDRNIESLRKNDMKELRRDALRVREELTDVAFGLSELENFLTKLRNMAVEPQNSMPDVVIWMLCGDKRKAYCRIPAFDVLYASNEDFMGRFCGATQTINLKTLFKKGDDEPHQIPAQIRVKIWLGQEKEETEWHKMQDEGALQVVAETYENQVSFMSRWCTTGPLMTRPSWSDSSGRVELKREEMKPPEGWAWDGEWFESPEVSLFYDKDAGLSTFMEECYVNECRAPGAPWAMAAVPYTDVKGDKSPSPTEMEIPKGWVWVDEWKVDYNRPCDEEGWEYTVEASMGGYVPVEKMYHMCRRRRFVRERHLVDESQAQKQESDYCALMKKSTQQLTGDACWEYAPIFTMKFHANNRPTDMVRRKRWHRKMKPLKPGAPCFFNMTASDEPEPPGEDKKDKEKKKKKLSKKKAKLAAPRMFLKFSKPYRWQLRAYMYQGRDLLPMDQSGLSDPYARVVFLNQSQTTERIIQTLCPTWDQTLIFSGVEIHGDPNMIVTNPPEVVIELFDYDQVGEDEFLGRCQVAPLVKLEPDDPRRAVLQWFPITRRGQPAGELLCAFELYLTESKQPPFTPPRKGDLFIVPTGIRPVMERVGLEIVCWGVRNMKKYMLSSVSSPSIEFELGGYVKESDIIKNTAKNPNFHETLLFMDAYLPKEALYMPPMNIRVRDHRQFGRKPLVGVHVFKDWDQYRVPPLSQEQNWMERFPGLCIDKPSTSTANDTIIEIPPEQQPKKGRKGRKLDLTTGSSVTSTGVASTSLSVGQGQTTAASPKPEPPKKKKFFSFGLGRKKKGGQSQGGVMGLVFQNELLNQLPHATTAIGNAEDTQLTEVDLTALDEHMDWWAKYYASLGEIAKCKKYVEMQYDTIKVYRTELEKAENHDGFLDFCDTFTLTRGKNNDDNDGDNEVGEFKGTFRMYRLPDDPSEPLPAKYLENCIPPSDPMECLVRVYIVQAFDLQPNDPSGLADPYVKITLGKKEVSSKDSYIPNCLNPAFGRLFELKCIIPICKDLEIRVLDFDLLGFDDVIGESFIDLENRVLTKFRATCGLPQSYCTSGPNQWRDNQTPTQILTTFCSKNRLPEPQFDGNASLRLGRRTFVLSELERGRLPNPHLGPAQERLALHVLNQLPLTKEHVETRPLYSPLQPGIEQGKLQMWVDIHPLAFGEPGPPRDITVRQPKQFVLRVIIWNTKDVILEEVSVTGEKMSDIYVKGWIAGIDERQETDVHYRSLDGEGNFNWRFVFPFSYLPAENTMIVRRKEHFYSLDTTEIRMPCNLVIQIWDNDKFSADDFLGTLEMNLAHMPVPSKKARNCDLKCLPAFGDPKMMNLFEVRRAYGFWPCYNDETGEADLTGKVEMELELLTQEESEKKPAGSGHDEPNENPHLDPPNRPDTSFLWFTSPWKTFKFIIWKSFKWYFIGGLAILLVGLLLVLFIYAIPGLTARKMMGI